MYPPFVQFYGFEFPDGERIIKWIPKVTIFSICLNFIVLAYICYTSFCFCTFRSNCSYTFLRFRSELMFWQNRWRTCLYINTDVRSTTWTLSARPSALFLNAKPRGAPASAQDAGSKMCRLVLTIWRPYKQFLVGLILGTTNSYTVYRNVLLW